MHPDGHLLVALALSELGRTYKAMGDLATAEQYHQRSLDMGPADCSPQKNTPAVTPDYYIAAHMARSISLLDETMMRF